MPTTFVNTKMYWAHLKTNLVARPRLIEKLDRGLEEGHSLTLVSAPAGYGKTTLLHEWFSAKDKVRRMKDERNASGAPSSFTPALHQTQCGASVPDPSSFPNLSYPFKVAWLTLDEADNDLVHFWSYVIMSLQAIRDELGETALAQLRSPQPPPVGEILPNLLNEIDAFQDGGILVLDDYHVVTSSAVHDTLAYLLESLPPSLHLVISTRSDPPIPIAKLRARGQVMEIRADDLRFTPDEAAAFLNRTMGLALSPDQVAALDERTEGWIAGLQMAALSMRGRDDVDGFIRAFAGTHRFIMDYLLEEVLARESEEVQAFLLQTSILNRLSGPLCDAVIAQHPAGTGNRPVGIAMDPAGTGASDGQETLEKLERRNLFVVPLDDERRWYRYHHLFADLLRTQLQRSLGAAGVDQLHIRAAEWHAQHGSIEEAIHHASMASDDERVERFIEQHYREILSRGEQAAMRFWSGKLSKERVYRRPRLCIYEAHSRAWFGKLDEADRLLDEAEKRIRSEVSAPDARAMLGHWAYIKSRVTAMRGDLDRAIEYCLAACENVPASNLSLQFNTRVTLGYEYFLNGDYANASPILNEAIQSGKSAGALIYTVAAACMMARLVAVQGLLHKSYDTYQMAAQLVSEAGAEHRDAIALVEVGIADVLTEWNELDAALNHVQRGLDLLPLWGKADDLALAYVTRARIHLAKADTSGAVQDVEKAIQAIRTVGVFSEASHAVEIAQAKLWLAQGDRQAAGRWVASQEEHLGSDDIFGFQHELTNVMRARVLIVQNRSSEAIGLLSRLEEAAQSAGRMGRAIEILLIEALALGEIGDFEHALPALTKGLAMAEPEGYVRIFLDEGRPMQRLLTQWVAHTCAHPSRDYCLRLLSLFDGPQHVAVAQEGVSPPRELVEPLTPRESEVLQLIYAGDSNKTIADKLVITTSAVKKHTGNILGKLGVTNRAQAIVKARQLGLFPEEK